MKLTTPGSVSLADTFERNIEKSTVAPLPPLRSDLQLLPADHDRNGVPDWTLYDPLRGKFYRIGWVEFEILKRWNLGNATAIVNQVNRETTIRATSAHVDDLQKMLMENELVSVQSIGDISQLLHKKHGRKLSLLKRLFTFALFYKKPLLNPDAMLRCFDKLLQPVYRNRTFFSLVLCLLALAVGLSLTAHAYELKDTFLQYMNPAGFLYFGLVLVFTNILHEMGHGIIAKHYGCSVRHMGVALIFMLPVCYCDTTDAWRLKNPKQRLMINAGGIAIEMLLALFAAFFWLVLPEGLLKTFAFFVAITSLGTTLLINLNPFLKFDGYYLLADFLQIDNLQMKSFSTMRWQLRTWVLGHQKPMPYRISAWQRRIMCLYATSTWVYRFFLYQVIALMVYQFWFKAMGIVMMVGVVCTMLVQPVAKELAYYSKSTREDGVTVRLLLSSSVFIFFVVLFLVPLPRSVAAPAVLSASNVERFYAPISSTVKTIHVQVGDDIRRGQNLFQLEDAELLYQRDTLVKEIELLEYQIGRQAAWEVSDNDYQITQHDLLAKQASLDDILKSIDQLTMLATDSGHIIELPAWLKPGVWVEQNEVLAEVANRAVPEVRAYVNAKHIERIQNGGAAFYAQPSNEEHSLDMSVISTASIGVLTDESLAVVYGGDIPVEQSSDGELVPIQDWHQVTLSSSELPTIEREQKGFVMFNAQPRSIAASIISQTYGALIRESGF